MKYRFKPTVVCSTALMDNEACLAEVKEHCSFYICSEANKLSTEKVANYYEETAAALRKERIMENYPQI